MSTSRLYSLEDSGSLVQVPIEEFKGYATAKEHDKQTTDVIMVVWNENGLGVDRFGSLLTDQLMRWIRTRLDGPYACRWTFALPEPNATEPLAVLFQADSRRYCLSVLDVLGFARAKKMGTTDCFLIYYDKRLGAKVQGPMDWPMMLTRLQPAL